VAAVDAVAEAIGVEVDSAVVADLADSVEDHQEAAEPAEAGSRNGNHVN
jgi:hypothetical protein